MTDAGAVVRDLNVLIKRGLKFAVVYADPAWRFEIRSEKGKGRLPRYPTTSVDEIKALPVPDLAARDCALFLWATVPKLLHTLDVMKVWGFEYKSNLVWDKVHIATGYWVRNQHELLLIRTRGAIAAPEPGTQADSVLRVTRGGYSAKPEQCRAIIERYCAGPYLEMFGLRPARGWTVWVIK